MQARDIVVKVWNTSMEKMCEPFSLYNGLSVGRLHLSLLYQGGRENIILEAIGETDKYSTAIFEGDIVTDTEFGGLIRWEIYFDEARCGFWCRNSKGDLGDDNTPDDPAFPRWDDYVVIGNIYQNPDMKQ